MRRSAFTTRSEELDDVFHVRESVLLADPPGPPFYGRRVQLDGPAA
jgi:hypothetical protein